MNPRRKVGGEKVTATSGYCMAMNCPNKRQERFALSEKTVARRPGLAQSFFKDAVRRKLIDANPFTDIESGNKANSKRQHFVDRDTITNVFDACPNAESRLSVT